MARSEVQPEGAVSRLMNADRHNVMERNVEDRNLRERSVSGRPRPAFVGACPNSDRLALGALSPGASADSRRSGYRLVRSTLERDRAGVPDPLA
jgi:hypothetical protein